MEGDEVVCGCESVSHGELGPVQNHEILGRVVTNPNHVRKDGSLKPGLFPTSHLMHTGLSLIRVDQLSLPVLTDVVSFIVSSMHEQTLEGLSLASAEQLRSIKDEVSGSQSLCVTENPIIDEPPEPDNPAHVIALRSSSQDETEIIRIKGILMDMFGKPLAVSECQSKTPFFATSAVATS